MKKALKVTAVIILVVVAVVAAYVAYVFLTYDRIEDHQTLELKAEATYDKVSTDTEYTIVTNNIGFGAYTADFTFFMDGGKGSVAESPESVKKCVGKAAETIASYNPDFVLIQEIDTDSTRSYHIDERELMAERFGGYESAFACNYHSAYLLYPITRPHGASNSGQQTYSRFDISSAERRSLPVSTSASKIVDLDRCYMETRIPADNGKELVIYNVHMSAYGGSDNIREKQMNMLMEDVAEEYAAGNYVICGGDFNNDFTCDSVVTFNGEPSEKGWTQPFPVELLPDELSRCLDYTCGYELPTCRDCDIPYKEGNFTIIVDGFLITDNIELTYLENVQTGFEYSDHNPVVMKFILK